MHNPPSQALEDAVWSCKITLISAGMGYDSSFESQAIYSGV